MDVNIIIDKRRMMSLKHNCIIALYTMSLHNECQIVEISKGKIATQCGKIHAQNGPTLLLSI